MKNIYKYAASFFLGVVFCLMLLQKCNREKTVVEIPKKEGVFKTQKPVHVVKDSIVYRDRWHTKDSVIEIEIQGKVNDSLAELYKKTKSELERYKLYLETIRLRQYSQIFEDDFLKINVFGGVQGEIQDMTAEYTLKPRKAEIRTPKTVFRLSLGGQAISNFQNFGFGAISSFQNSKGEALNIGYVRFSKSNYYTIGYQFSLIDIKR